MIDGTRIVYMDLTTWKKVVRYINESRPQDTTDLSQQAIKDAFITKQDFLKILEQN